MNDHATFQTSRELKHFMGDFDRTTAERGAHYFKYGAVLKVTCEEPGERYSAIVRGGLDYEVVL